MPGYNFAVLVQWCFLLYLVPLVCLHKFFVCLSKRGGGREEILYVDIDINTLFFFFRTLLRNF